MKITLRVLALAALSCLAILAADKSKDPSIAAKRAIAEVDREKLSRIQAQLQLLQVQFQQQLQPVQAEQNELIKKLCAAIGVPEAKMATECKVDIQKLDDAPFGQVRWEKQPDKPAEK